MTDRNVISDEGSTSTGLLQRVKLQDPQAWRLLVKLYGPLVCMWCQRTGLREHDIEDVGQEVFAVVHRKIQEFRREKPGDSFRAWLRAITRNKICDRLRQIHQREIAAGGSSHQQWLEEAILAESAQEASREVQILARQILDLVQAECSEEKWLAFYRVVVLGHAPADVAQELGLSTNTIYLTRSRVLHRLREELGDLLNGDLL